MRQIIFPAANRFYLRALLASLCLMLGIYTSHPDLWLKDHATQFKLFKITMPVFSGNNSPVGIVMVDWAGVLVEVVLMPTLAFRLIKSFTKCV